MDFADCDANRQQILSLGGTAEITEWKPIKTEIMDKEQLSNNNSPIYNLNGQRMQSLQKGINIVNGKKVLMK